ncbi:MAG: TonB-dependent receptor, partial [Rhodothermales bacterium]
MRLRIAVIFLTACVGLAGPVSAQDSGRFTFVVRGVPLGEALERLVGIAGIDLVYTSRHVDGLFAYCNGRDLTREDLLKCVLNGSGLEYVRSVSGAYVLIESIARPPAMGDLAGNIVDSETGEPLPYANVMLAEAASGTTTNGAGMFTFASLVSGPYRVVVTYVGYETAVDSVWIDPGARQRVRIALHPKETLMSPIVVDGLAQRLPSTGLGESSARGEMLRTSPIADVSGGLASLSGVAVHQPLADVLIQGGATGEHTTLLDGVPVRDPVSLGRYLSAFSPLALGRVTVHKAGFGAEHGSHLSGLVTVTHDLSSSAGLALSADPLSLNGRATTPIRLSETVHGAFMAAARSSFWGVYRDPAVESLLQALESMDPLMLAHWTGDESFQVSPGRAESDVQFSDFHSAARLHLSPFRILDASVYRARNRLTSGLQAASGNSGGHIATDGRYDWTNWIGQVRHNWLIGARSSFSAQLQGSWNSSTNDYAGFYYSDAGSLGYPAPGITSSGQGASNEDNWIRELAAKAAFSHSLSPHHHIDAGIDVSHFESDFTLHNPFVSVFGHAISTWQSSAYVGARLSSGLRFVLEPGVRLTFVPDRRSVYAEPRIALRYDSPEGRYAARIATGLYRQFVNQFDVTSVGATALVPSTLFWLPLDGTLAPPRAYHASAEALWTPDRAWSISMEGYHKWQPRLLVLDYVALASDHAAALEQSEFITPTSGRVYGAGLGITRTGRIEPALRYTYSHATRRFPGRFLDEEQPAPWNTPHRLEVDLRVAVTARLDLNAG